MKQINNNWVTVRENQKVICYVCIMNENYKIYPPNEKHRFVLSYSFKQISYKSQAEVKGFTKLCDAKKVGLTLARLEQREVETRFVCVDIINDIMKITYDEEQIENIFARREQDGTCKVFKKETIGTETRDCLIFENKSPSITMGFMRQYLYHKKAIEKYKELCSAN